MLDALLYRVFVTLFRKLLEGFLMVLHEHLAKGVF